MDSKTRPANRDSMSLTNRRIKAMAEGKMEVLPITGFRELNPMEIDFVDEIEFNARADRFPSKSKKGKNEKRNSQELERLKLENVELIDKILSLENEFMRMENDLLSVLQQEKRNSIRIQCFKETIKIFQSYANKHRICKHECGKGSLNSILDQVRQLEDQKNTFLQTLDEYMEYEDCSTQTYIDSENVDESMDCNDSEDFIEEEENTEFDLHRDFKSLTIEDNVIDAKKDTIENSRKRKKTFDHNKKMDNKKRKTAEKEEKQRADNEKRWKKIGENMLEDAKKIGIVAEINTVTVGNGDCFYSAFLDQCSRKEVRAKSNQEMRDILDLDGYERKEDVLKRKVISYIESNKNDNNFIKGYKEMVEDGSIKRKRRKWSEYIKSLSKEGAWADELIVQSTATWSGCSISVTSAKHTEKFQFTRFCPTCATDKTCITCTTETINHISAWMASRNNFHFQSIHPISKNLSAVQPILPLRTEHQTDKMFNETEARKNPSSNIKGSKRKWDENNNNKDILIGQKTLKKHIKNQKMICQKNSENVSQKDLASSFESLIEMDLLKMESKEFDNKPEILEFNMDIDPILDLQNDTYPYLPLI